MKSITLIWSYSSMLLLAVLTAIAQGSYLPKHSGPEWVKVVSVSRKGPYGYIHATFEFKLYDKMIPKDFYFGHLELLIQPPSSLVFKNTYKEFTKLRDLDYEELKEELSIFTLPLKDIIPDSTKKCGNSLIEKLLIDGLPSEKQFKSGIFVHDSAEMKALGDVSSVKVETAQIISIYISKIDTGIYTWTGSFEFADDFKESSKIGKILDDWVVSLVIAGNPSHTDGSLVCVGSDALSSKVYLAKAKKNGYRVLRCNGIKSTDDHNEDISLTRKDLLENFEIEGSENPIEGIIFGLKLMIKDTLDDYKSGYAIKLRFPSDSSLAPYWKHLREDDIRESFKMSDEKMKIDDLKYDPKYGEVTMTFKSSSFKKGTSYKLLFNAASCTELISTKGKWEVALYALNHPDEEKSELTEKDLKGISLHKYGSSVKEGDEVHQACNTLLKRWYEYRSDRVYKDTAMTQISKSTFFEDVSNYVVQADLAVFKYANLYLLRVYIKKTNVLGTHPRALLKIKLPVGDASMNDLLLLYGEVDHRFPRMVTLPRNGYHVDKDGSTVSVYFNLEAEKVLNIQDSEIYYEIPILFNSTLKYPEDFEKRELWDIELSNGLGISKFPLRVVSIYTSALPAETSKDGIFDGTNDPKVRIGGPYSLVSGKTTRMVTNIKLYAGEPVKFIVSFDNKVLSNKECNCWISSASAVETTTSCSDEGKSVLFAVKFDTEKRVHDVQIIIDLDKSLESIYKKSICTVELWKISDTNTVVKEESKQYLVGESKEKHVSFDEYKVLLFRENFIMESVLRVFPESLLPCMSKEKKIVTLAFPDDTRASYMITRLLDCKSPWLPPVHSALDKNFISFEVEPTKDDKSAIISLKEDMSIGNGASISKPLEFLVKEKRFLEHTLYILFDKSGVATLVSQIIASGDYICSDIVCQPKHEADTVDYFVKKYFKDNKFEILGGVKYGYFDSGDKTLTLKRIELIPGTEELSENEEKKSDVKDLKSAIEHLLDDGFISLGDEHLMSSFSLFVVASYSDIFALKRKLAICSTKIDLDSPPKTALHPIFVEMVPVTEGSLVELSPFRCGSSSILTPKSVKGYRNPSEWEILYEDVESITKDSNLTTAYCDFEFETPEKILKKESPRKEAESLRGFGKPTELKADRKPYSVFFGFQQSVEKQCVDYEADYNIELGERLKEMIYKVNNVLISSYHVFAVCTTYPSKDMSDGDHKFKLSYHGEP